MNNQLKTIVLLSSLTVLLLLLGQALGPHVFPLLLVIVAIINLGAYFYADKLVLAMYRAKKLGEDDYPQLHRIITELAAKAKIAKPRLYLIDQQQPNAFATGRDPNHAAVAVTAGILNLLNERELKGVLAHELSHIKNYDILIGSIAALLATAITYIAQTIKFGALFGSRRQFGDGFGEDTRNQGGGMSLLSLLVMVVVAPLAALLIQMAISRSREYQADASGAKLAGDPGALADALEKLQREASAVPLDIQQPATASLFIVSPLSGGPAIFNLFATHPPLTERVNRLRALVP